MRSKRWLSLLLPLLAILFMLPAGAAAGELEPLSGGLSLGGYAGEGGVLYADFSYVYPVGVGDSDVYYSWTRDGIWLSSEGYYVVSSADAGSTISLTVSGIEEQGYFGSLSAAIEIPSFAVQEEIEETVEEPVVQEPETEITDTEQVEPAAENTDQPETEKKSEDESSETVKDDEKSEKSSGDTSEEGKGNSGEEKTDAKKAEAGAQEKEAVSEKTSEEVNESGDTDSEKEQADPASDETKEEPSTDTKTEKPVQDAVQADIPSDEAQTEEASAEEDEKLPEEAGSFANYTGGTEPDPWEMEPEEEASYQFSVSPESLNFGTLVEGYNAEDAVSQTIVISNEGNQTLTFETPFFDYGYFAVSSTGPQTLEPGQSFSFTISPVGGLDADFYDDMLTIRTVETQVPSTHLMADFRVEQQDADEVLDVDLPEEVYITNGTERSSEAFDLPDTVMVYTQNAQFELPVTWNMDDCSYNPYVDESQSFTVTGNLHLPSDVSDTNGLGSEVSVDVYADGRDNFVADANYNEIVGVDSDEDYTTETKIRFSAYGDGMDNDAPLEGDTRFYPASWQVLEERGFSDENFESSFRIAQEGGFDLSVTYLEQVYTDDGWQNTGVTDTKNINFNVTPDAGEQVALTPAVSYDSLAYSLSSRTAVQTADEAPVRALLLVLAGAAGLIISILLARKVHS